MPLIEEQKNNDSENWHILFLRNSAASALVADVVDEGEKKTITSSHDHHVHKNPLVIFLFFIIMPCTPPKW